MKKWVLVLFPIMLAVVLVVGNWKPEEKRQGIEGKEATNATLKWMLCGERYKESDIVFTEFNKQIKKYLPAVEIEFELVEKEEYQKRWNMKMATGEPLDLAWFGNDELNYTEEVRKGSFMVLDYLLASSGHAITSTVPQELWNMVRIDGNVYGIPVDGPLYRPNYAIVFNKRLIERFGNLEEIIKVNQSHNYTNQECFDVFEPFIKNAKDHNALGTGVSYQSVSRLADKGYEGIYGADSPFVIRIFDSKLKVYNKYGLSSYKACFETMRNWYNKGYIREDEKNLLNPSSEHGKNKGSIMYMEEYGKKGTVPDMVETEFDPIYAELDGYRYIGYDGCRNSVVIPKSARYPRQAVEVINLLYSEKGKSLYRLLANGIEKKHYIHVNDNVIARMSDNGNGYLYKIARNTLGNVWQDYETSDEEFEQIRKYNREAIRSPLMGFSLDTRMIALEMERVNLIVHQYREKLLSGSSENWESLYEEFMNKMKEAGSDKIVEEMQKQIDVFCAEKKILKSK